MRSARCGGVYEPGEEKRSAGATLNATPQAPQKAAPGTTTAAHLGHVSAKEAPQCSQNLTPSRFCAWHRGQIMAPPSRPRAKHPRQQKRSPGYESRQSERVVTR